MYIPKLLLALFLAAVTWGEKVSKTEFVTTRAPLDTYKARVELTNCESFRVKPKPPAADAMESWKVKMASLQEQLLDTS